MSRPHRCPRCPASSRAPRSPGEAPACPKPCSGTPSSAWAWVPPFAPGQGCWAPLRSPVSPCGRNSLRLPLPYVLSPGCSIQEPLTLAGCTYAPLPTSHQPPGPCGLPQVPPVPSAAGRGRRCPRPWPTLLAPLRDRVGALYGASLPFPLFSLSPGLAAELYIQCAKCI